MFKLNGESVIKEKWCWEAYYNDGTTLKQFDEKDNSFHQFKEIDQERLGIFKMVNGSREFVLMFEKGMKLIHFYLNTIIKAGEQEERVRLYVFGFERAGKKNLMVITPDDNLVFTNNVERIK